MAPTIRKRCKKKKKKPLCTAIFQRAPRYHASSCAVVRRRVSPLTTVHRPTMCHHRMPPTGSAASHRHVRSCAPLYIASRDKKNNSNLTTSRQKKDLLRVGTKKDLLRVGNKKPTTGRQQKDLLQVGTKKDLLQVGTKKDLLRVGNKDLLRVGITKVLLRVGNKRSTTCRQQIPTTGR